ncbi:MAG: glycosyltransferase N-terminal domain-containing protein [Verrucomicrobiota bacterium]
MWFAKLGYQIVYIIGFVLSAPYYGLRMWRRGSFLNDFDQRLGLFNSTVSARLKNFENTLWIHAVSVGEMLQAKVLVEKIRQENPKQDIVITTTTVTGRKLGRSLVNERTILLYNPLDFIFCVKFFYNKVNPRMLVLVEQELWPNYIWEASKRGVPVWVVNARMSDRSAKRLRKARFFMQHVMGKVSWVGVQSEEEIDRLAYAGFHRHTLFPVGSLKFEVAELAHKDEKLNQKIRQTLGWNKKDFILCAGSTHKGEEIEMLRIFKRLKQTQSGKRLKLLIAPRHVERSKEVLKLCTTEGLHIVKRSEILHNGQNVDVSQRVKQQKPDILLLDKTGELASLYALADVVFVGKSLCGKGGQNFLEAIRWGRAVVVGPNMSNFKYTTKLFKDEKALEQVKDWNELEQTLEVWLRQPALAKQTGQKAKEIFSRETYAAKFTVEGIMATLHHIEV